MPHPTQKRTKSSKRKRASHFALRRAILIKCTQCGKFKMPYRVCEFCGFYKGKQIIAKKQKKKTTKQKAQERKEREREKNAEKSKK